VAAASIGQVHRAVTTEGKEVALKVVRPGVAKQLRADIAMFLWCARWADRWIPSLRRLRLVEVIRVFETSMRTELDMRLEASAASELRDYAATSEEGFYIPWVDWTRTASSFMTLEWIEGVSIYDVEALALAGHDPAVLAQRLAVGFFQQAYRDGVFHADPHPGNLLVRQDGKIALVDFGIVGRIDEPTRLYVTEILDGFLRRDYCRVAKLHQLAGYVPADQDMGLFAQALRAIGEPIVGQPVEKISVGSLLQQLFELTRQFDMQTQPQLLLLQKTTLLIESVGHQLYRHMNLWLLAEPWIESWVWDHLGVEARLKQRLYGMVEDWLSPETRVMAGGAVTTALAVPRGASEDRWPWLMLGGLVGGTMVWMVLRPETLAGWFAVIARMLG
jgi:ubiquinone biosynthesis protein